jgi:butyryl-CoA dehydrogenase
MFDELDRLGASESDSVLRTSVRDFVERLDLRRVAAETDRTGVMPPHVYAAAREAGYFGITTSPEYGGMGCSMTEYCVIIEELARGSIDLVNVLGVHNGLVQTTIQRFASEKQKREWLPLLASGEHIGAFGMTEPGAGVNIRATQTRAVRDRSGFRISGRKMFITNGQTARRILTLAQTEDEKGAKLGFALFAVDTTSPGFSIGQELKAKMGTRSVPTAELVLDDVAVPEDALVGEIGQGLEGAVHGLTRGRAAIAALTTGVAREALLIATRYADDRVSGHARISSHQVIRARIARMAQMTYSMAAMTYHVASVLDAGRPAEALAGLAKVHCSEHVQLVLTEAIQTLGGYGFMQDFPLERMYRDTRVCSIYEGTNDILQQLAARTVIDAAKLAR